MQSLSSKCVGRSMVALTKTYHPRYLLVLVVLLAGLPFRAFAQDATVVGTVTDQSGSVMANVKITITNAETSLARTITTNDSGQYVAVDLRIGHYSVKAEASGFKVAEQKGLVLNVGDRRRVDFQMALGAAQETVTVEANVVHVQADSGEASNLITGQQLSQLSVNGRGIYQLAALTPGGSSQINALAPNVPVGGDAGVEFNGMRQNHNIYLLDGGEDDDRGGAGGMSIAPSSDAIGEFRALTSNYSADYGLSSGGTMTLVLKSGTNTLHASAWEFNRNDALDARNLVTPQPQKVAELRVNVFGFNVGGPVTFGKLYNPDRKKTFFCYNMEWRKYINGGLTNQHVPSGSFYPDATTGNANFGTTVVNVPTAAKVNSSVLFVNCPGGTAPAGVVQGSPFPNNTIPKCMISGNAASLLTAGIFPKSNSADSNGNATFIGGNNSPTNLREG